MEKQEEKFRCPYCGKIKDVMELNYNSELGSFEPTIEKFGNIRDAYDYNHSNYRYTKYEVPICDDCLIIHQESGSKATIIALIVFLPIVCFLLYHTNKIDGGFWEFIVPAVFFGVICLGIRLAIKVFLINRNGISYRANKSLIKFYNNDSLEESDNTSLIDRLLNSHPNKVEDIFDRRDRQREEFSKSLEEWNKKYGRVGITPNNRPPCYLDDENNEKSNTEDNNKPLYDYDDDDFEGYIV